MRLVAALAGLLWFGVLMSRAADTNYVAHNGQTPSGTYLTWATAASNIQDAIDVAGANNTVLVGDGTYALTNRISITANIITVKSLNGTNFTFINGNNYAGKPVTNRCVYMTKGVLDGFTISNGCSLVGDAPSASGGGIYINGGSVYNCYIYNNYCSNNSVFNTGGGGILLAGAGSIVSNCTVTSNIVDSIGGGVYFLSGLLINSYISGNTAYSGGGMYHAWGTAIMTNCTVAGNSATYRGGGIYIYSDGYVAANCIISNNVATSSGGGMYLQGFAGIKNSIIIGNRSTSQGGGVAYSGYGEMVSNCQVIANFATNNSGGGIYAGGNNGAGSVVNCIIARNVSGNNGAGLYFSANGTYSQLVQNCSIYGNTNLAANGGGVYINTIGGYPYGMINCTIASNQAGTAGGGLYAIGANNYIGNCIIYSNVTTNDIYDEIYNNTAANTNNYWYSCVRPTPGATDTTLAPNQGNTTMNPMFIDFATGNYRLSANSPCVNTGTNGSWATGAVDLDGRIRIRYGTVDMGAYEAIYQGTIFSGF